ncbi:MAG: TylF/MycF/NovP-related O-methyltransferase [bacterium]|nr:TylF/MycF/NovP-related O-methyltransferase [bacterium]
MSLIKKSINALPYLLGYSLESREEVYVNSLRSFDYWAFQKVLYLSEVYGKVRGIEGDIVECGIGYSETFQILSCLLKKDTAVRNLWGFDSFEGFPEPTKEDTSSRNPKKGEWKVLTVAELYVILGRLRLDKDFIDSRVKVVKGFFEDTLHAASVSKIALLHLDVDLYQSYKTCLTELFPRIVKGGVVLFDEYDSPSFPGAKKAIDEYFKGTSYRLQKDGGTGKYFLIKT